jgi:DNA-binding NarL/FixJ family response regulator
LEQANNAVSVKLRIAEIAATGFNGEGTPNSMTRPRLVLADDHEDLLHEVTALLWGEFDVIGIARNGTTLMEIAAHLNPDVVVTDFKMPGMSGIDASRWLLEQGLCKAVVLLTMYADRQLMDGALKAGILGFVLKVKAGEDLIPAIHSALRGETYVSSLEAGAV